MTVRPDAGSTVSELVRARAALHPDLPAVVDNDGTTTYADLVDRAELLAAALIGAGVQPGEPVGVSFPRGTPFVVALMAVGLAGAVYVPLNPHDPPNRIEALLDQVGVAVVLHDGSAEPQRRARVVSRRLVQDGPADEQPLYVMFTSGSTGAPKGVIVPHRAVVRLAADPEFCPLAPGDALGFASNQMFDAATWEIWSPLISGASIVTIPAATLMHAGLLAEHLHAHHVSHLMLTTSLFDRHVRRDPSMFGSLRFLIVGGEALDPATVRAVLRSETPPSIFCNGYGPTESTTFAIHHRVVDVPEGAMRVPIGRPIAGTTAAVMDERGIPVAPGTTGELWLGGSGIAHGYLDDPELTGDRFVTIDPDGPIAAGRWYRTGDLATMSADGLVDCLGRIDDQVKIYGYRIEPSEVEAALRARPGVGACAVIAERRRTSQALVAFVVPSPGDTIDLAVLRAQLRAELPAYLVPSRFSVVDELPITENGKLDRAALLARAALGAGPPDGHATPADEVIAVSPPEVDLVAVAWRRVLGHDAFGLDDELFDVGGDSMLLIEIIAWICDAVGTDLAAFQSSIGPVTVRRMAAALGQVADRWKSMPALVKFSDGALPSLALIPGAGATILGGRWLATELASDFAVVGGNAAGLTGRGRPPRSLVSEAAIWLAEWDAAGFELPEVVVGFSSGAVIAHEIAAQLVRQGHPPMLIVLIDPPIGVGTHSWARAQLLRLPRRPAMVRSLLAVSWRRLTRRRVPLKLAVERRVAATIRRLHQHSLGYGVGSTLLLVASHRDEFSAPIADLVVQWDPHVGDLQVAEVVGTHLGLESVVGRINAPATAHTIIEEFARVSHAHQEMAPRIEIG